MRIVNWMYLMQHTAETSPLVICEPYWIPFVMHPFSGNCGLALIFMEIHSVGTIDDIPSFDWEWVTLNGQWTFMTDTWWPYNP